MCQTEVIVASQPTTYEKPTEANAVNKLERLHMAFDIEACRKCGAEEEAGMMHKGVCPLCEGSD
jgi:hypothetical protein